MRSAQGPSKFIHALSQLTGGMAEISAVARRALSPPDGARHIFFSPGHIVLKAMPAGRIGMTDFTFP
jgi:hypothetical protein